MDTHDFTANKIHQDLADGETEYTWLKTLSGDIATLVNAMRMLFITTSAQSIAVTDALERFGEALFDMDSFMLFESKQSQLKDRKSITDKLETIVARIDNVLNDDSLLMDIYGIRRYTAEVTARNEINDLIRELRTQI